ncbi:MAG: HEAT repeat domain-containing protein [Xanthomonadales bacterium]|nr:HEAT repeat domain-containing protein [Xanthomonadales bacterium]
MDPTNALMCALLAALAIQGLYPETARAGQLSVRVDKGLVSVDADRVSLGEILRRLGRETGMQIIGGDLQDVITCRIESASIERALGQLLRRRDYGLRYTLASEPPFQRVPKVLTLYPGASSPTAPSRSAPPQAAKLWQIAELTSNPNPDDLELLTGIVRSHGDPAVRAEAVYGLGVLGDPASLPVLEMAVRDPDSRVRIAAVEALGDVGGDAAALALSASMLTGDQGLRERVADTLKDVLSEDHRSRSAR